MLRTRAVEFVAEAFKVFYKDIFQSFVEGDLFNTLLFYFDHYPYHNILHAKVHEIIILSLDKNIEGLIYHFLYETKLV
jgi:hypothetical protein